jgi:threonine/homoserine/homoserine lactone efflux protein
MNLLFLFKGLLLGFSVAAPVGPIGILCINRTVNKNFTSGFVSGLGAATADLFYGLIAGFGLTVISNFLLSQKIWIHLVGIAFLLYLGLKTITKKEQEIKFENLADKGLFKDYLSTLFITITNPLTILFFLAIFAGLGLSGLTNGLYSSILLVAGVFLGSCSWWLILSSITHKLKNRINSKMLKRIDLLSGILLFFFGVLLLINLLKEF